MFLLCSFFLHPASVCGVSLGMQIIHPHTTAKRDAAAELQAVLLGIRAEAGGWGLNALLGWLLSRWVGRWIGQIAAQFEDMVRLFRAGHVWAVPEVVTASRAASGIQSQPAEAAPRLFDWLADGFGSLWATQEPTQQMRAQRAESSRVGRGVRPLRRAAAVARISERTAPRSARAVGISCSRTMRTMPELVLISWPFGGSIGVDLEGLGKIEWGSIGQLRLYCSGL